MTVQSRRISASEMTQAYDVMLAQERAATAFFIRYDVLMTSVCPHTMLKIGGMVPPPATQEAIRLLFGTSHLGFLLRSNPFLEREATAALQYIGYTSSPNISSNSAINALLYRHNELPVGIQFAAILGRENTLFSLATQLERIQPQAEVPQMVWDLHWMRNGLFV